MAMHWYPRRYEYPTCRDHPKEYLPCRACEWDIYEREHRRRESERQEQEKADKEQNESKRYTHRLEILREGPDYRIHVEATAEDPSHLPPAAIHSGHVSPALGLRSHAGNSFAPRILPAPGHCRHGLLLQDSYDLEAEEWDLRNQRELIRDMLEAEMKRQEEERKRKEQEAEEEEVRKKKEAEEEEEKRRAEEEEAEEEERYWRWLQQGRVHGGLGMVWRGGW